MSPAELAAKWRCYTGPEDVALLEADARAVRLAALREAAALLEREDCREWGCCCARLQRALDDMIEKEAANVRTQ